LEIHPYFTKEAAVKEIIKRRVNLHTVIYIINLPDAVTLDGAYDGDEASTLGLQSRVGLFMAALRSRCVHYIFALWFLSIFLSFYLFYSSPNLSRRRLDVYHTSTHGVALVRI